MRITLHTPGTPCWVDLATPDPAAAKAFYGGVFGWVFADQGEDFGGYVMCTKQDLPVAGMGPMMGNVPKPMWTVYLATADADATVAQALALGGTVAAPAMDVANLGRMAVIVDPTQAAFGIWQSGLHTGTGLIREHGALTWAEVNTGDAPAARDFYAGLFDLAHAKIEGMDYFTLNPAGATPSSGVLQMTAEWAGIPPHWMVYFAVESADAAAESIKALGGEVKHGPFDTPHGRMAVCMDPMGAPFSVIEAIDPG